ncbi:MAG: PBP1A family penicillin-binding protein [Candidatus Taylorbacteria bacterium]|nr:PBP1A family penicillin-binding protein [Candidatus Taylorbacteria bacterium]
MKHLRWSKRKRHTIKNIVTLVTAGVIVVAGITVIWLSTLKIPDLSSFDTRKVNQSTKIYDRTGTIVLYDVHQGTKRTVVPFSEISRNAKNATISIEDPNFYSHFGIEPRAIIRAIVANLTTGSYGQGGSTITQQVVKNAILTGDKTITRKLKEFVLALKLDHALNKDQILSLYLNEIPYGGSIYGIEEASKSFFGISAKDLTITQAAYLAALEQAPSYYSPFGGHILELEQRKNLVLKKMLDNGYITQNEYKFVLSEKITFQDRGNTTGIKAPHFVFYVRNYLENKYGVQAIEQGGYKVITTLDYDLEKKAEDIVKKDALNNAKNYNAGNASIVAIDPQTGQILAMVGSRDYFDHEIDGKYNIATAHRQPGSSFKPFVYATAFNKGYTPETVLFDLKTQFNPQCDVNNISSDDVNGNDCYSPGNYDSKTIGPITLRDALAQSRNIPAVKLLYLAGENDSITTAKNMGVKSLGSANQYGLSLVLGGAEVTLLEMTSAYGVFAAEGIRNPETSILKIEDNKGQVIERFESHPTKVLPENTARLISSILSDNNARAPQFGVINKLTIPGRDVAAKTGTTNDYKDTWIVGYTPQIVIGAWAGNNNNAPIDKKVAGTVIAPTWNSVMNEAIKNLPNVPFSLPDEPDPNLKPILRGIWRGGISTMINGQEQITGGVHDILYWINKDDPLGPAPQQPVQDIQFPAWEYGIRLWAQSMGIPN